MKLNADENMVSAPILPEGFKYRFFKDGDEHHWARIEKSVLEFQNKEEALEYFSREFLPHMAQLKKRCVFIEAPNGLPVATTTAWFAQTGSESYGQLHWVAVCPEYQGIGLGTAIVKKALTVFSSIEPHKDIWLGTQTWSHAAIRLYHRVGFRIVKKETVSVSSNRYPLKPPSKYEIELALEILKEVIKEPLYQEILDRAN